MISVTNSNWRINYYYFVNCFTLYKIYTISSCVLLPQVDPPALPSTIPTCVFHCFAHVTPSGSSIHMFPSHLAHCCFIFLIIPLFQYFTIHAGQILGIEDYNQFQYCSHYSSLHYSQFVPLFLSHYCSFWRIHYNIGMIA